MIINFVEKKIKRFQLDSNGFKPAFLAYFWEMLVLIIWIISAYVVYHMCKVITAILCTKCVLHKKSMYYYWKRSNNIKVVIRFSLKYIFHSLTSLCQLLDDTCSLNAFFVHFCFQVVILMHHIIHILVIGMLVSSYQDIFTINSKLFFPS